MRIYFIKAEYTDGIYKLNDFFVGNVYKQDNNKMQDIDIKPNDGNTTTVVNTILPDGTNVNDYSHVIVPEANKIYEIDRCLWLNKTQTQISLIEDAFIGHYQQVKDKKLQLERSNDVSKFIGMNDVDDMAIRHTAQVMDKGVIKNYPGMFVVFTFQGDVKDLSFSIKPLKGNVPLVDGVYSNITSLRNRYPKVITNTPWQYDYYLKFAEIGSGLYQCVYDNNFIDWIMVNSDPRNDYQITKRIKDEPLTFDNPKHAAYVYTLKYPNDGRKVITLGDVKTTQVAFPLDASLSVDDTIVFKINNRTNHTEVVTSTVPSYYSIDEWNNGDKLLSVKIVPPELIFKDLAVEFKSNSISNRLISRGATGGVNPDFYAPEIRVGFTGRTKTITSVSDVYTTAITENFDGRGNRLDDRGLTRSLPLYIVSKYDQILNFNYSAQITGPKNYEPFKKYYLYLYGEMIEMPGRYLANPFNVRLAITSTDVLYEVYTDKMNIIGSGRLMWMMRYSQDQLRLFEANNPTYKEQFWTNQVAGAIKGIGFGAIQGGMAGAGKAVLGSAMSTGTGLVHQHYMKKGLKDKADQIFGQNDISLTAIKGFGVGLIIISPEQLALEKMIKVYDITGFPTHDVATINSLNGATTDLFGTSKVIMGQLLETVKNKYITNAINRKLQEGVIIV